MTSLSSCTCARLAPVRFSPATSRLPPVSRSTTPIFASPLSNEKGKLEIELTVERGRGYVSAAQNKDPQAEISRIPIDSIYSPVVKVTYKVEATRVEQRTDFDRLVIDVETKAAITPRDALASAGKTLVELFGLMRELNEEAEGIEVGPPSPTPPSRPIWPSPSRT